MAKVSKVNMKIPQGTSYSHQFNYIDEVTGAIVDITGYTARCQFRDELESASSFFEATTEDGNISIDGPAGTITLLVPHADSTAFTILQGFYDIEIIAPNTQVIRVVQGKVAIDREVTR